MISILKADARKIPLADESVQCVVTSPPYWGLRKYAGEQELVWGGREDCEHGWGGEIPGDPRGGSGPAAKECYGGQDGKSNYARQVGRGNECLVCGAWRGAYGLEPTVNLYVQHTVEILREIRRVLRDDGVVFWNIGDSYATHQKRRGSDKLNDKRDGSTDGWYSSAWTSRIKNSGLKDKDLCLIPFRVALAAQADGWFIRSDIIWAKPNPMPESVTDRPTDSYEHILMLTKRAKYYWDAVAVREDGPSYTRKAGGYYGRDGENASRFAGKGGFGDSDVTTHGRNLRNVWNLPTQAFYDWGETSRQVRVEAHEADDGTKRITSPDCPLHGDSSGSASNASCGERVGDGRNHNEHSGSHLAPEQPALPGLIAKPHGDCSVVENLDSVDRECSGVATDHSKKNHRKGHVPLTNQPCKPSGETPSHTGHNAKEHGGSDLADRISESNSELGGSGGRLLAGTESRSAGKSCTCEYYNTINEKTSHFATFPEELPKRCILAATSSKGACAKCGTAWERVVDRSVHPHPNRWSKTNDAKQFSQEGNDYGPGGTLGVAHQSTTVGWRPDCKCAVEETMPCLVLDPFAGSGTVGKVAIELGRRAILCDLAYQDLALKRTAAVQRPLLEILGA